MTTPTQSDEEATLQQHIEAILDGFSTGISNGQIGGQGIMYKYNSEEDTSKAPEALIGALWCLFRDKAEQELEAVKREYFEKGKRDLVGALEELSLEHLKALKSKQAQGGE